MQGLSPLGKRLECLPLDATLVVLLKARFFDPLLSAVAVGVKCFKIQPLRSIADANANTWLARKVGGRAMPCTAIEKQHSTGITDYLKLLRMGSGGIYPKSGICWICRLAVTA